MIVSELDEVLYWNSIGQLIEKIKFLQHQFFPDNTDQYQPEKVKFYLETISSRADFFERLAFYKMNGKPIWVSGKNQNIDDITLETIQKVYNYATVDNGKLRAEAMENAMRSWATHLDFYSNKVLSGSGNFILELTVGAGLGTAAVIKKMKNNDKHIGVDIDFRCAKNADGIGRYYQANALGVCCNLWDMPFEDEMFSIVCSHFGIDECREMPTIIKEAARVLKPGGKIVFACRNNGYIHHKRVFDLFNIAENEAVECLYDVRLYSNVIHLDEMAYQCHLTKKDFKQFEGNRCVVEYIK